jgi:hypothetical protein
MPSLSASQSYTYSRHQRTHSMTCQVCLKDIASTGQASKSDKIAVMHSATALVRTHRHRGARLIASSMHAVVCCIARAGPAAGAFALGSRRRDALGQVVEDGALQGRGRGRVQLVQAHRRWAGAPGRHAAAPWGVALKALLLCAWLPGCRTRGLQERCSRCNDERWLGRQQLHRRCRRRLGGPRARGLLLG